MESKGGLVGDLRYLIERASDTPQSNEWWVIRIQDCLLNFYKEELDRKGGYRTAAFTEEEIRRVLEK